MPRDTRDPYDFHHNWYHPTADLALTAASCSPGNARVGFWDDTGVVKCLKVWINGTEAAFRQDVLNRSINVPASGLHRGDVIRVEVRDAADNRQVYEKTVGELMAECQTARSIVATPTEGPIANAPLPMRR